MIGPLRYSLRLSPHSESGLEGKVSGLCLSDMLAKVYWNTIRQIEAEVEQGQSFTYEPLKRLLGTGSF